MKITYHGHSCISVETKNTSLIIDPFITGNPLADIDAKDVKVDYILITHAHEDHVGDALEIAKTNHAPIITGFEFAEFLESEGYESHGMGIGGSYTFPFGTVKFTQAIHSSSYQGKDYGLAAGIILDDGKCRLYHTGDTALYSDMSLVDPVDICFIPIGDNYTMGIEDALKATKLIKAKLFVPIHYNTFPLIKQDPYAFANKAIAKVLNPGESISL